MIETYDSPVDLLYHEAESVHTKHCITTRGFLKFLLAMEYGRGRNDQSILDTSMKGDDSNYGGKSVVHDAENQRAAAEESPKQSAFKSLGWLDRFLAVWILLAMIIGILLGNFVPGTATALEKGQFVGVSVPIGMAHPRTFSYEIRSWASLN
jgi:hypothetical protein